MAVFPKPRAQEVSLKKNITRTDVQKVIQDKLTRFNFEGLSEADLMNLKYPFMMIEVTFYLVIISSIGFATALFVYMLYKKWL